MKIALHEEFTFNKVLNGVIIGTSSETMKADVTITSIRIQVNELSSADYVVSMVIDGESLQVGSGSSSFLYKEDGESIIEQAYRSLLPKVGGELVV